MPMQLMKLEKQILMKVSQIALKSFIGSYFIAIQFYMSIFVQTKMILISQNISYYYNSFLVYKLNHILISVYYIPIKLYADIAYL